MWMTVLFVYVLVGIAINASGFMTPFGRKALAEMHRLTAKARLQRLRFYFGIVAACFIWPWVLLRYRTPESREEVVGGILKAERATPFGEEIRIQVFPHTGETLNYEPWPITASCSECGAKIEIPDGRSRKLAEEGWRASQTEPLLFCPKCATDVGVCPWCNRTIVFGADIGDNNCEARHVTPTCDGYAKMLEAPDQKAYLAGCAQRGEIGFPVCSEEPTP